MFGKRNVRQAFTSRYLSSKVGWTREGKGVAGWRVQPGYVMAGRDRRDRHEPVLVHIPILLPLQCVMRLWRPLETRFSRICGQKKEAIQPLDSRHAAWKKKETERQCRRSECNPEGAMLFDLGWVAMKQKITSVALQRKRKTPASWAWLHVQPKIICTDRSDTADLLPLCLPASHFNSCSQWKTWPTLQHQTIDTQVSFCYGRMETCFPLCHS